MNYRSQFGAENPADVFIPILLATFFASIVGLITVAIYQKINLFNATILAYLGSIIALITLAGSGALCSRYLISLLTSCD